GFSFPWVSETNPLNFQYDNEFDRDVFFQDFQFVFNTGNDMEWLVGAEYYEEKFHQKNWQRANQAVTRGDRSPTATGNLLTGTWVDVTGATASPEFEFSDATVTGTLPLHQKRTTKVGSFYGSFDW
ncbi:MAG: hypothetical protein KDB87_19510, partial [Flavobacteriales bacterium]|nr:hypothetical protein [Flavobacteriales bacterium]